MHAAQFLGDLTLTIAGGTLAGWIARKIGLHPILGYVVAGIVFGPFTPGYTAQHDNLAVLSELGLVFLLFTLGLEFSIKEIRGIGAIPIVLSLVAALGVGVCGALAAAIAHLPNLFTFGLVLIVSSTAIGIALLKDAGLTRSRAGTLVVSVLIVQDLLAIIFLVFIEQSTGEFSPAALVKQLVVTVLFLGLSLTLGAQIARRLVVHTLANAPADQRIAVFAGIALVAAYLGHLCGLSFAFGAFVAGAVVAGLAESSTVEKVVAPLKDLFMLCFFVAIGGLIDPGIILQNWVLVAVLSAAVIAFRYLLWWAFALGSGIAGPAAVALGIAMVPLGEFNVVLGRAAASTQRLNPTELATCVGVMFFSITAATLAQPLALRFSKTDTVPQTVPSLAEAE